MAADLSEEIVPVWFVVVGWLKTQNLIGLRQKSD
jgi:hypothetical protein